MGCGYTELQPRPARTVHVLENSLVLSHTRTSCHLKVKYLFHAETSHLDRHGTLYLLQYYTNCMYTEKNKTINTVLLHNVLADGNTILLIETFTILQ